MRRAIRTSAVALGVVLVTAVLLELGSRALLGLLSDRWASRAQVQASLELPARTPEARAPGPEERRPAPPWMQDHILHPYLGFVRNPALAEHRLNGIPVHVAVNRYGFFGPDPLVQRPGLAFRVALFGGSVALELFLEARAVLERQLAADVTLAARRIEIVCLALDGMKQPQQLLALAWLLTRGARFDAVVNLDGYNEVALPFAENARLHVASDYPRSWRAYAARVQSVDTTILVGRLAAEREQIETLRARFAAAPWRESGFALLVWHALHRRYLSEQTRLEAQLRSLLQEEAGPGPELTGPVDAPATDAALLEALVRTWQAASREMAHLAQANGMLYLHFLQPNQYLAGSKALTPRERATARSPARDRYRQGAELGYPRLVAAGAELARAGIAFHDLTGLFRDEPGEIYKDHCCHYTPRGYQRVATEIARVVAARAQAPR